MSNKLTNEEVRFKNLVFDCYKKAKAEELISLWNIYEVYGKPRYKSPKRIMHYPSNKYFIEDWIVKNNMEVERVIQYNDRDVLVNFPLAMRYISNFDQYYLMKSQCWVGVFGLDKFEEEFAVNIETTGLESNDNDSEDYTDLPF